MSQPSQTEVFQTHHYHAAAYHFVEAALPYSQQTLRHRQTFNEDDPDAHISGHELLEGIRLLGQREFGLMARTVFNQWGIYTTDDFGRIVFEFIERGEMKKTDSDKLSDFFNVYDFREAFDDDYEFDLSSVTRG